MIDADWLDTSTVVIFRQLRHLMGIRPDTNLDLMIDAKGKAAILDNSYYWMKANGLLEYCAYNLHQEKEGRETCWWATKKQ